MRPAIPNSTSEYRAAVAAVGAVVDLAGARRDYRIHVSGADCYYRVGPGLLVPADVVVAGATRSPMIPNGGWIELATTAERIALMPAAGTAEVWIEELAT